MSGPVDAQPEGKHDALAQALPYIVPYAVYMALTYAADYLPDMRAVLYVVKVLAVAGVLWHYRKSYTELRPRLRPALVPAALIGVLVIVAWVGLDPYYPQSGDEWRAFVQQGARVFEHPEKVAGQFSPYAEGQLLPALVTIIFRLIGAVLLVPIFEELLIRSWLIRFLVRDDIRRVPMGTFTWLSFGATAVLFGLSHHEWLAGVICGVAFNLLLYWRKDLFQCIVAHAAANLALAVWVLTREAWHFW